MILNFVRVSAVANALWLLAGNGPWHTGNSGTFDTALMAILIPMFLSGWWRVCLVPLTLAIITQGEGTAAAVLAIQAVAYFIFSTHWLFYIPVLVGFFIPIGMLTPWKHLAQEHILRLKMWSTYIGYWWDSAASRFIGFGTGTFQFHAPRLEINGQRFAWAHNDWIEILFEHGFIGLAFALCAFLFILYKTKNHKKLFCAVLGFGTCMFFYSPLRVVTGQLILIALCIEIFKASRRQS